MINYSEENKQRDIKMVQKSQIFNKYLLIIVITILICSIPVSMILMQAWFENEVQKQLGDTEADINSIEIISLNIALRAILVTVNTSVNNPHDVQITIIPANLSVEYLNGQLGIIFVPEITLEGLSKIAVFNATFHIPDIPWLGWWNFLNDLIDDNEVAVNVSGVLTITAPALFGRVSSTVDVVKEIVLYTDLILTTTNE